MPFTPLALPASARGMTTALRPIAPYPARPSFIRRAWHVLVAVKDGLVLLLLLLFFAALAAGLSQRPGGVPIADGALTLELQGSIVELPARVTPQQALTGGQLREYRLRDLVTALDAARDDGRVKAVVLDLDGFLGGGQVALSDVGEALDRVRAKKKVLAFATGYSDDAYQLAAHADEIWLDPMGLALFSGPGGSQLYYKGLLDRVGANVHVYRVGKFKSAVEPFERTDQSPEAKAASEALAGALWSAWQADVAEARPKARLAGYVADPAAAVAGTDLAQAALRAGLVDRVADKATFERRVAQLAGEPRSAARGEGGYARIELKQFAALHPRDTGTGAIGIVTVAGTITDGDGVAGGTAVAEIIDRAVRSGKHKALVLRVDSPGGSAIASEKIRVALEGARAKKLPVVVSMANVAASGGYWMATAGDRIFAEPATVTGSIGVFGVIPTFEASLAKIGVTTDGVRTTLLSGQPDVVGGTNAAFDAIMQRSVESSYGRFLTLVSRARKLPVARVDEIGQGRVWDGGAARQLGLVDQFGGLEDAIADAARRAGLDPAKPHAVWLEQAPGWQEALAAMLGSAQVRSGPTDLLSTLARARTADLRTVVADVEMLTTGAVLQARCLDCPAPSLANAAVAPQTLFALIAAWLRA